MALPRLVKIGGQPRLLPPGTASTELVKYGHAAGFSNTVPAWSAFEAMFGIYDPNNSNMSYSCQLGVRQDVWPNRTRFYWSVTPDGRQPEKINGYFHLDYGNYDDSARSITPRKITDITQMTITADWTYTGDIYSGMLSECWLSSTARPTGPAQYANEIGYFSRCSPAVTSYVQSLPDLGTFTDASGTVWRVADASSGSNQPYYMAYRQGYADHHGPLHYKDYFTFLVSKGKLTGQEWFNGVAYGAEPTHGTSELTILSITATYTGA